MDIDPSRRDATDHRGASGHLITGYALAIMIGGPILTLWLARYRKREVLISLMLMFVVSNLITAFVTDDSVLMFSLVMAGLM